MFGTKSRLPAVSEVIEGEIVDEVPDAPKTGNPVINVTLAVIRHPHTQRVHRHLLAYPVLGAATLIKRMWESRTTARYDRYIRAAEKAGNHQVAVEWDDRRAAFVKARHDRKMQRVDRALHVLKMLPVIGMALLCTPLVLGLLLAVARHNVADVVLPIIVIAHIAEVIAIIVSVTWGPLVLAAPWLLYAWLWHVGRTTGESLGWNLGMDAQKADPGIVITADTIVLALRNLPIADLRKAFKDSWVPTFTLPPVREGNGYKSVFSVPLGVTPQMVADQRSVFARNLHREPIEVWTTAAEGKPGFAELWVADSGTISRNAPEYPLLHEGTADVFAGVPGGVVARGDAVLIPVVSNNLIVGGQMGQGKSNAARVYMLGCALDPLCEEHVFVFANNGDFDSFTPRLATYQKGVEDDVILAAISHLHELYAEVARREQRLAELGAKKLTRALAQEHPDLRPSVTLFSECHELFGHPEYGATAADLCVKTAKRARKTGVVLAFDTQSSRKEAIPPRLVELISVNSCFYVKTWRSNDGFLGDGAFQAGIRATDLRPGRDRGTAVTIGISDEQFELLRWYFIVVNDDTGFDAAKDVIARAVRAVDPQTRVDGSVPVAAIETHDLLEDLDEILKGTTGKVRVADLPGMLRKYARTWVPYQSLTGKQLQDRFDDEGVKWVNTGNVPQLDPADLRTALARRRFDDE